MGKAGTDGLDRPVTWGIGKEAAGVVLEFLHEADLAIVPEAEQVPFPKYEDGGDWGRDGGDVDIQRLLS